MNFIKKLLFFVVAVVFVIVWAVLSFNNSIEHIEDTNGADNYSLQTITDENIEKLDFGAKGFGESRNNITNRTVYSSRKYTGVTEILFETSIIDSYTVYINYFELNDGNAKLVLLKDDVIIHEFVPNEGALSFTAENVKGSVMALRIAGESADFKLDIN